MTRIVQISDLHFGYHRAHLVAPLLEALQGLEPDFIAVTGDLTHRGRSAQYSLARQFLDALPAPWQAVPGNHDVPLFNIARRVLRPFSNFRRAISDDLAPRWQDGQTQVIGLNTTNPKRWQVGMLRSREMRSALAAMRPDRLNIIAAHHPFQHLPDTDKALMPEAHRALARLAAGGVDVILSGHLHIWACGPFMGQPPAPGVIQLQAGTALCNRPGEDNDFALIEGDRDALTITRMLCSEGMTAFRPASQDRFTRGPDGWTPV